jgi:hypothetical protein
MQLNNFFMESKAYRIREGWATWEGNVAFPTNAMTRNDSLQNSLMFRWFKVSVGCRIVEDGRLIVATLAFGSWPRQGGCKVAGLIVDSGVTSHALGSAKSVREWTLTLPSELPRWELVRVGVPKGLPKLQREIWGVKSQWLVALFISMESSWSVDV